MATEAERPVPQTRCIDPKILYFGTPVILISSLNEDGSANLAPMSSGWALGRQIVLGLGTAGKTYENLKDRDDCVLNVPNAELWQAVERLAPLTGKWLIPQHKQSQYRFEAAKFEAAGLTELGSEIVRAPRVAECPLQLESRVAWIRPLDDEDSAAAVAVDVLRVHAHEEVIVGEDHIDPAHWTPLIYNFRHYYGLGQALGKTFRAEI